MKHKLKHIIFFVLSVLFFISCSNKDIDPVTGEKKIYETNLRDRLAKDSGRTILFGREDKADNRSSTGILWRATVDSLNFIPVGEVDYQGGIYSTDWYGPNSKEKIKIVVNFYSKNLTASSIKVLSYKKLCDPDCRDYPMDPAFSEKIKEKIIAKARHYNIEKIKEDKIKN